MSNASIKQTFKKIAIKPSAIILGSIVLLILSQLISSLLISLMPITFSSDSINLLIFTSANALITFGVLLILLNLYSTNFTTLGIKRPIKSWYKPTLVALVIYVIFSIALISITSFIFNNFDPNQVQNVGISSTKNYLDKISGFLALVILTPLIEETLFRGLIFIGLRRTGTFWTAALVSSGLFALAHGQWNISIDTFALGIALCYLAENTRSIVPGMLIHALKNSIAFVLLFVIN